MLNMLRHVAYVLIYECLDICIRKQDKILNEKFLFCSVGVQWQMD